MKQFFYKIYKRIKKIIKEAATLDLPPKYLAFSLSLGVYIGISPFIGLRTYMAIGASIALKLPLSLIYLGSKLNNLLTLVFFLTVSTKAGLLILGKDGNLDFITKGVNMKTLINAGKEFILPFFIGANVLGILSAVLTFALSYPFFIKRRKYKEKKQNKNIT